MKGEYSILIVGAGIVLVPAADEFASYKGLIESILLAQLIARKKIEKTPDVDWYNMYVEFLDRYWLRHSKARQDWSIAKDSIESVGDWFIAAMSAGAIDKAGAATTTLEQLARLSGTEPAMGLLRGHMQGAALEEAGSVRLLVVVAHTPASISSVYMEFETDQRLGSNPLIQRFQAKDIKGTLCMRFAGANLSEILYAPAREAIALKVRDRFEGNVAALTLKDNG